MVQFHLTKYHRILRFRANPIFFDYTWTNWLDYYEPLNGTQESAEEAEFQMPRVFDGEIQEIVFDSGKYADLLSPLQRHSAGINRAPDPAVSVIVN